jgi:hypothetical protein
MDFSVIRAVARYDFGLTRMCLAIRASLGGSQHAALPYKGVLFGFLGNAHDPAIKGALAQAERRLLQSPYF